MLAEKLIAALRKRYADHEIVLTTTTATGKAVAAERMKHIEGIAHFPFDFKSAVKKALAAIKPCLFIMIETEIWPNLLLETRGRGIPCMIVNGRISDRSIRRYRLVRSLIAHALEGVKSACMSSPDHAGRIRSLGLSDEKIRVTGNIKFDITTNPSEAGHTAIMKTMSLTDDDAVFVAGSTAEGEDEILIGAYLKMRSICLRPVFIIAPRHISRVMDIEALLRIRNLEHDRFSLLKRGESGRATDIIVVDTIGDLAKIYSAGRIVFVGGSLVPIGGHNIIEPASCGKPVIFGRYMENFREIAEVFLERGAGFMVRDEMELFRTIEFLLKNKDAYRIAAAASKKIVEENAGALDATVAEIGRMLVYP